MENTQPRTDNSMRNDEIVFSGKTEAIYKIIVIGDPAVGKGELIAKFATYRFEEEYRATIGVSILKEPIELKEYNATVNLMFWDIAGQPHFYTLHRPYFNGADGMFLVFDITRSSTFSNINNWYSSAVKYGLSGIPRILIGNKAHLTEERKIILPMAEHLAEKLNASYYETSPLSGENFKEAFEKISELVYRAKRLNDNWNKEPLIFKAYEGPTQPSSSISDSMKKEDDMTLDNLFFKKKTSSSERDNREEKALETYYRYLNESKKKKSQTLNQSKELDKREKKALETTFRYFNESKVVYYKPEKSETVLLSAIETGDLVVLTSKYRFQTILAFFCGILFLFISWGFVFLIIPMIEDQFVYRFYGIEVSGFSARIIAVIMTIILIGVGGRLITFAIYLRHYFIVLDSQGIYYKKIGKPRFISWNEVVKIIGYQRRAFSVGRPTERAVRIYLISKTRVRFNETNYHFKHKFYKFDDVFRTFKFWRDPFIRYGPYD